MWIAQRWSTRINVIHWDGVVKVFYNQAQPQAESIGWVLLEPGTNLQESDEIADKVLVVGVPQAKDSVLVVEPGSTILSVPPSG